MAAGTAQGFLTKKLQTGYGTAATFLNALVYWLGASKVSLGCGSFLPRQSSRVTFFLPWASGPWELNAKLLPASIQPQLLEELKVCRVVGAEQSDKW